ncbi:MAG: S8 family serine peptidase, partial [Bacteroidia bacterium]|nr:S8 family serine peptidase [Bacteroidia bacterium]
DLIANHAINLSDPIDGIDNDSDGFIDNYYGWDFVGSNVQQPTEDYDPQPETNVFHGTAVAGYAAATPNNQLQICGSGFHCKFLPVKCSGSTNILTNVWDGMLYAAMKGAKVINCSFGSYNYSKLGEDVCRFLASIDVLVIASAGNFNTSQKVYPASYATVLSLAGTIENDIKSSTSSFGFQITVSAPSSSPALTLNNGNFTPSYATSWAAPIVSGMAGVLRSQRPNLSARQIKEQIRKTTDPINLMNPTYTEQLGYGRVNYYRMLNENASSIRIDSLYWTDSDGNQVAETGDTLFLYPKFINLLEPIQNATAWISNLGWQGYFLDSTWNIGNLCTNCTFQVTNPARFIVTSASISEETWFRIAYSADNYQDYEWKSLFINPDFVTISTTKLQISFCNNGNFGYSDYPNSRSGNGVTWKGGTNLLRSGGFLIAKKPNFVANSILKDFVSQDTTWQVIQSARRGNLVGT